MFKNRIVAQVDMDVTELIANPLNWRRHPLQQSNHLLNLLNEIGVVQSVVFNERTGYIIDGHLRVELAKKNNEVKIPVTVVDLTEDEERIVLASFDKIGAMATIDNASLGELLNKINSENSDIRKLIEEIGPRELDFIDNVAMKLNRIFTFTLDEESARIVDAIFEKHRGEEKDNNRIFFNLVSGC